MSAIAEEIRWAEEILSELTHDWPSNIPDPTMPSSIIKNRMASFEESLHNNAGRVPYVKGIPSARYV
jgi:hypothetical protein